MYICLCKAVVEEQIKELIAQGISQVRDVQRACAAGSDCGSCLATIRSMIEERRVVSPAEQSLAGSLPAKLMK